MADERTFHVCDDVLLEHTALLARATEQAQVQIVLSDHASHGRGGQHLDSVPIIVRWLVVYPCALPLILAVHSPWFCCPKLVCCWQGQRLQGLLLS